VLSLTGKGLLPCSASFSGVNDDELTQVCEVEDQPLIKLTMQHTGIDILSLDVAMDIVYRM